VQATARLRSYSKSYVLVAPCLTTIVRPHRTDMTIMLADIDPGNLTMVGVLGLFTVVAILCLVCAGVTYLTKEQRASRGFLIAAGIFFGSGLVLSIVGKVLGEKYGFP